MKKSWLEFYAYAVSFATVACLVVTTSIILNSLIVIANPEFGLSSHEYRKLSSNEGYIRERDHSGSAEADTTKRPSVAEINALREADKARAIAAETHDSLQTLVKTGIFWLVSALVLWAHICIACKERKRLRESEQI